MGPALIRHEELSPRNESRSGTEVSIVTVATLSHDFLKASSQNQPESNVECPQLTDTTTGSNNKIFVFQEDAGPPSGDLSKFTSVSLTDHNLSNDSAIPRPTVSFHNALPDSNRSQGSHTSPSWSVSRMDSPVSSLIEPINQPSSYVIRRLVTDLPTDYDLHHII